MRVSKFAFVVVTLITGLFASATSADEPPPFDQIEQRLAKYAKTRIPRHFPNAIVTRHEIKEALVEVEVLGWEVPEAEALLKKFPSANDPLVKELRRYREFAKDVAKLPNVYDRLDRLRAMPYGDRRIRELATTKDGYKLIEYMTTTSGGEYLTKQVSRGRNGGDFRKPTGRLYTFEQFVEELKSRHPDTAAPTAKP